MINDYKLAKIIRPYDKDASVLIEKTPTVSYYLKHGKLPFNGSISSISSQRIIGEIERDLEQHVDDEVEPPTGLKIAA